MYNVVHFIHIGTDTHPNHCYRMPPCRMGMRGRLRAVEAQAENEDQPQLATAVEIAELR